MVCEFIFLDASIIEIFNVKVYISVVWCVLCVVCEFIFLDASIIEIFNVEVLFREDCTTG